MSDEFYVGYLPRAPRELAAFVRRCVVVLAAGVLCAGVALIVGQPKSAPSRFEFGVNHEYTGRLELWPYPRLRTSEATWLLVDEGKHGWTPSPEAPQSASIRLRGSLIQRGADRMLQIEPGSVKVEGSVSARTGDAPIDLGGATLTGEIVDTKCYLGVMNPGERKIHRDCAARCISGGIPPAFIARDASGCVEMLLLASDDGHSLNHEVLPFAAEPVEISGRILRSGANLVFRIHSPDIRRK